ncbi:MAG: MucBP domain-containing protein [Eubacteriales bacterium]|nr:MucBP domain-containing protein [Eubacteriales bacterium]
MRKQKLTALLLSVLLLFAVAAPALAASQVTVTVKYVTGEKNLKIAEPEKITGTPGAYFQVNLKEISGYTFVGFTHNKNNSFIFPDKSITMLAHYAKVDGITVKYVDENGNKIADSVTVGGHEGQVYTVNTPYIAGYSFLRVEDPNNGVIKASNKSIKVVYRAVNAVTMPPVGQMMHLRVRSVDQDTGAMLNLIENSDKPYGIKINISDYQHAVSGYQFTGVTVNGVAATSTIVPLTKDTDIVYYYKTNSSWIQPIVHEASLVVRGVDESTGRVFREFYNDGVSYGSAMALNPPSVEDYSYDYCTVSGAQVMNRTITIYNDTVVTYFYKPLWQVPVIYGGTIPQAVAPGPVIGSGAIPTAVVGK